MSSLHLIPIFRALRSAAAAASIGLLTFNAHALFDDDEARRAILELRQKVDIQQTRNVEEIKKANEDNAQLRRRDRKSTRLNSSHHRLSRMPSSA